MLQALANRNGAYARVARAIDVMHRDVASLLDIDGLADLAGMSASTFHRTFKRLCTDSPLQYLKKLRLEKARGLIVHDGILVHQAAEQVGYESASQFSREFKRRYGCTPASLVNKGGSELLSA
jgi:transcriptional regulator GlxA family with amidase domain